MKTLLVRPVLVKIDTKDSLISDRNVLTFSDGKIYNPFKNEYCQLILISLDLDEKIEVGDKYFDSNLKLIKTALKVSLKEEVDFQDRVYYDRWLCTKLTDCRNIIATQSQLSPDLINQLVAEYNNGGMQDFEIEMHNNLNDPERLCDFEEPYIPNGFVVVVDKHVFGVSDNPNINGVDYENTPVPDYPIGKPLDDYINAKHSQDRCMGFIDGYNTRKLEESISYSEEEIKALINKVIYDTNSNPWLITSKLKISDRWFNENKKK